MTDKIAVALRVLSSIQNHTHPVAGDIERLQNWVAPEQRETRYDELACIVIADEAQRQRAHRLTRTGGASFTF
jgi:hypothetical protein